MNKITKAREMAIKAHGTQTVSDGKPYLVHLENVVANLKKFGLDKNEDLVVACYLHDTLEDTSLTYNEIKSEFGETIADIVHRVTDEPGKNRKERKEKTYPKIKGHQNATIVKLCDRIANVEYNSGDSTALYVAMYQKEQPSFENGCFTPGLCDDLWNYLRTILK